VSDLEDYINAQIDGANSEPDEPADEPDEPDLAADEADEPPALLAGKYKDVQALEKAYKELESMLGQRKTQVDDDDDEEEYDEDDDFAEDVLTMPLPIGGEPQNEEQFWAWFTNRPQDAALWAVQNADRVGNEFVTNAIQAWASVDPTGHAMMIARAEAAAMREEMLALRAEMQQQMQPHQQRLQTEHLASITSAVTAKIPDQGDRTAAMQFISSNPLLMQAWNAAQTPQQYADLAVLAHNQLAYQHIQEQQAALQQPAAAQPRSRASTRTRQGTAPAPSGDADELAQIVNGANSMFRAGHVPR